MKTIITVLILALTALARAASVTDYGAIPNDALDDTTACQKAINAVAQGGKLEFPAGTYKTSAPLDLNVIQGNDTRVLIEGWGANILIGKSPAGFSRNPVSQTHVTALTGPKICFQGFNVIGDGVTTQTGILLGRTHHSHIADISVNSCTVGIKLGWAQSAMLERNQIFSPGQHGIVSTIGWWTGANFGNAASNVVTMVNNRVLGRQNSTVHAYHIYGVDDNRLINCISEGHAPKEYDVCFDNAGSPLAGFFAVNGFHAEHPTPPIASFGLRTSQVSAVLIDSPEQFHSGYLIDAKDANTGLMVTLMNAQRLGNGQKKFRIASPGMARGWTILGGKQEIRLTDPQWWDGGAPNEMIEVKPNGINFGVRGRFGINKIWTGGVPAYVFPDGDFKFKD